MSLQDDFGFRTQPMEKWVEYFKLTVKLNGTNCWALSDEDIKISIYASHKCASLTGQDVGVVIHASAVAAAEVIKDMQVVI
jgi:hypothetical protein